MRRFAMGMMVLGLLAVASGAGATALPSLARGGLTCVGTTIGPAPVVLVLSGGRRGGPFLDVLGEAIVGVAGLSFPLSGTAHARADGGLHLALAVHSGGHPSFTPIQIEGTLDPPGFDGGSGEARLLTGVETVLALAFAPATCPAVIP